VETVTARLGCLWQCFVLTVAVSAFPEAAFAHRLDEYLQATLVMIEPGEIRLDMNLTPGVAVADQLLSQMHSDSPGVITPEGAAAYTESLRRDLTVQLDRRDLHLSVAGSHFPTSDELHSGWGIIQIAFSSKIGPLHSGAHVLSIVNRHLPGISVYLLNAGQSPLFDATPPKAGSIAVTAQKRNENQSIGEIDFTFQPPPASSHVRQSMIVLAILLFGSVGCSLMKRFIPRIARSEAIGD